MEQFSASPIRIVYSIAAWLGTGSDPGRPRHTGQTSVLGSPPNAFGQPQNSLVLVPSSTWVSRPISGSYLDTACVKTDQRSASPDPATPPHFASPDPAAPPHFASPDPAAPPHFASPDPAAPPHFASPDPAAPPHFAVRHQASPFASFSSG